MRKLAALLTMLIGTMVHAANPATRPAIVSANAWGSTPQSISDDRKQTPKYITIHHAGVLYTGMDPVRYLRGLQAFGQKEKHWPDLPYHFVIAPDGRIFEGRPIIYQPESNTKYELSGNVGIELMGNFEAQRPSAAQVLSCVRLVAWLIVDQHINPKSVRGHKDAAKDQTVCPGRDFNRYLQDGSFMKWVDSQLKGHQPAIELGSPLSDGPTTNSLDTVAPTSGPAE